MTESAAGPVVDAVVGVRAADWRGAVHAACAPLVSAGALEPRYPERCIAIAEEHGPYMVLAPGIALAHARPDDGVLRLCLSAAVLATPVEFGHDQNDPVDVVLAFGSPDDGAHLALLQNLAEHLLTGLADQLRLAPDRGTAVRALSAVG
ncbi:PTS sugar transporter subunit IIA [Jiangella aurantiaca]|uniref:Ascorbate-specific PTS system EIIA component n=1 Tax=Jiangella aurantiaca TaxID=2530373 RepID=A0A4V2YT98_9ACTN|nr:PTS sugar transporter subunit IIA [Jiangella aurantiaca]TDD72397.1 PTS sugar transporter subunit IIA [Jiangella aurantiaca]